MAKGTILSGDVQLIVEFDKRVLRFEVGSENVIVRHQHARRDEEAGPVTHEPSATIEQMTTSIEGVARNAETLRT